MTDHNQLRVAPRHRLSSRCAGDTAEFCYKCDDFYHPNDEGGLAWNDPEIGIEWPELVGEYSGCATAKGYHLKDGTSLTLSEKDQKWLGIAETFKFK